MAVVAPGRPKVDQQLQGCRDEGTLKWGPCGKCVMSVEGVLRVRCRWETLATVDA